MKDATKKYSLKFPLINILLFIASSFFSLIISEFVLHLIYNKEIRLHIPVTQWDSYVGHVNIPNKKGYSESFEYKYNVTINSHGLRDREFSYIKPFKTLRIGIFGDSVTYGWGVENNEPYPKILEYLLKKDKSLSSLKVKVEVLNFAISATGTSHQLAWYQKEGRKYHLDIVMLGFFSFNDFEDNLHGVFSLRNDKLVHLTRQYDFIRKMQKYSYNIPCYKFILRHSNIVNLLREIATNYYWQKQKKVLPDSLNEKILNDKMIHLNYKLIEKFNFEADKNNSTFMVLNLPVKNQKVIYSEKEHISSYIPRYESLIKILKTKNIKVLDMSLLLPVGNRSKYFFEDGVHFNKLGHKIIASIIYENLLPELLHLSQQ